MKSAPKISTGLLALGLISSTQAEARTNEFIHSTVLNAAGISSEAVNKMVADRILLKVTDDCFSINTDRWTSNQLDIETIFFLNQLRALASDTTLVRQCRIADMQLASQDTEPLSH